MNHISLMKSSTATTHRRNGNNNATAMQQQQQQQQCNSNATATATATTATANILTFLIWPKFTVKATNCCNPSSASIWKWRCDRGC